MQLVSIINMTVKINEKLFTFNDVNVDESGIWTEVCSECASNVPKGRLEKYKLLNSCNNLGCKNEADYYLTLFS